MWSAKYALTVAENCSAMELMFFFVSAVVAFPIAWRRKLAGIAIGIVFVPLVNLVRVASLFAVEVYAPARFELMHLEIWPLVLMAVTLVCWLAWIRWATREQVPWPAAP
jgi:exosortase/archaeosortase family protein